MNLVIIICWLALLAITLRYAVWYVLIFQKAQRLKGLTPLPSVWIYTTCYSPLVYVTSPYIAPLFKYLLFSWGNSQRGF
jgi:hypothetical protein